MKIIFQTSKPSIAIIENCKSKHKLFFEKKLFPNLLHFPCRRAIITLLLIMALSM